MKQESPAIIFDLTGECQKLIGQPLRRRDLKQDPILKDLLVIRAPNSTNFRVTPEQWQRVYELKG